MSILYKENQYHLPIRIGKTEHKTNKTVKFSHLLIFYQVVHILREDMGRNEEF